MENTTTFILKMHPITQKDFLRLVNAKVYTTSAIRNESGGIIGSSITMTVKTKIFETEKLISISIYDDGRVLVSNTF